MATARLLDRAVLHVTGDATEPFLQGLLTADMGALKPGEARPAALLSPQGKILFDMLLSRIAGGFRLDVAAVARPNLAKRLALYRLRSKVAIEAADENVHAVWNLGRPPAGILEDRRFTAGFVGRLYGDRMGEVGPEEDPSTFAAIRIRAGVAEAENEFPGGELFPHEVLLDQNGGVSFTKGCYVGQEVVSRMQHRGTARRRLMLLAAGGHAAPGAAILASGGQPIGTVLASVDPNGEGSEGFGLVRIDRLVRALGAGEETLADGVRVKLTVPAWAGYALPEPTSEGVDIAPGSADREGGAP